MSSDHDPAEPDTDQRTDRPAEPLVSPSGAEVERPATSDAPGASADEPATPLVERQSSRNMLPGRERRRTGVERLFVRLVATCGIVGIGVAIAAIMVSSKSQGWLVGLVVSVVSVVLAGVLWSSRQL